MWNWDFSKRFVSAQTVGRNIGIVVVRRSNLKHMEVELFIKISLTNVSDSLVSNSCSFAIWAIWNMCNWYFIKAQWQEGMLANGIYICTNGAWTIQKITGNKWNWNIQKQYGTCGIGGWATCRIRLLNGGEHVETARLIRNTGHWDASILSCVEAEQMELEWPRAQIFPHEYAYS